MKYQYYFINYQNNRNGLTVAFAGGSTTSQTVEIILKPFNKHLLFVGSFISETKKSR